MHSEGYKTKRCNAQNKRDKAKRNTLLLTFGKFCKFCEYENRITIHRKDGTPHKDFRAMSWKDVNDLINNEKNEYVSVCFLCHQHVHWCMSMLGMSWDDICERLYTATNKH